MSRRIVVVDPGAFTTVQDTGRPGWAHLGVPRSGALDGPAAALANRLVGNVDHAPVLETTLTGFTFRSGSACTIAVTGARAPVTVDGRACAWGEPVTVGADAEVHVGHASTGVRSYIAFSGGIDVPAELGSCSHDTLSGLGPEPLTAGQTIRLGLERGTPRALDVHATTAATGRIALFPGPRADWFGEEWRRVIAATPYVVGAASNRIAVRLEGPSLDRRHAGELASEGIVLGAVQVPPNGQPLVFLNDHPTTGGYPVIAVVRPSDLPRLAQVRPGDRLSFDVLG